jgi:hypothetical protein
MGGPSHREIFRKYLVWLETADEREAERKERDERDREEVLIATGKTCREHGINYMDPKIRFKCHHENHKENH